MNSGVSEVRCYSSNSTLGKHNACINETLKTYNSSCIVGWLLSINLVFPECGAPKKGSCIEIPINHRLISYNPGYFIA